MRYLGIGKESIYGTQVNAQYYIPIIEESLRLEQNYIYPETVAYREHCFAIAGKKQVSGGWEQYVNYDNIGLILKAALGSEAKSNPAIGVVKHEFKRSSSIPSLTVHVGIDDITEKVFTGVGINELKLELLAGEILKCSVDCIGRDEIISSLSNPTFSNQEFIDASKLVSFKLDGINAYPERFSITIKNNIDEAYVLGSRLLQGLEASLFEVEGEFDAKFSSTNHLNDFLNSNHKDLMIKFQGNLIASGYYYELQIDCDEIVYDAYEASINKKERMVENIKFKAIRASMSNEPIIITLQNAQDVEY
jgi:hypothetical protein